MNKFTFIKEKDTDNSFDTTKVIIECDTSYRDDLIEAFHEFLKACGFYVDDLE